MASQPPSHSKCFKFDGNVDAKELPEGQGTVTFLDKCQYLNQTYFKNETLSGVFVDGQLTGQGQRMMFIEGQPYIFTGQWQKGELIQGTLKYPNGDVFTGTFKNLYPVKGQVKYLHGAIYEGEMNRNDQRQGQGTLIDEFKHLYEGQWNADQLSKGKITYPSGNVFIGTIQDYYPIRGIMKYKNGSTYEGDFAKDQAHGQGKYVDSKGNIFTGEFANSQYTVGQMNKHDGTIYIGKFHDLKPAEGRMNANQGYIYTGQFKKGRPHGLGRLQFNHTNISFEGQFDDRRIVSGSWTNLPLGLQPQKFVGLTGPESLTLLQPLIHLSGLRKVNQPTLKSNQPHQHTERSRAPRPKKSAHRKAE